MIIKLECEVTKQYDRSDPIFNMQLFFLLVQDNSYKNRTIFIESG